MRRLPTRLVLAVLLATPCILHADPSTEDTAADEKALRAVKISADTAALLEFLRRRTGDDADRERVAVLIRQLGDDSFAMREKASQGLVGLGWPALSSLRSALDDPDEEVKERARDCIAAITSRPGAGAAAAAVRLLRARKPAGASAVLLRYLPYAEAPAVEDEVLFALASLGVREGKVEGLFLDALKNKLPERRAAAALVLGRSGTAEQKGLVRPLLTDADGRVRLRAAQGLIAGRDRSAVPALIALLVDGSSREVEQAEALLVCLAGKQAPRAVPGDTPANRKKNQDAWQGWWKTYGGQLDLARVPSDLPAFNPVLRAHEVARQFLTALLRGDVAGLKRTTDIPFTMSGDETFKTREQLDTFLESIGPSMANRKVKALSLISVEEYARFASANEKEAVARLSKGDVRVLHVQMQMENQPEEAVLFIRTTLGQARVVGVGEGKRNKPPR